MDASELERVEEASFHLELLHPSASALLAATRPLCDQYAAETLVEIRQFQDEVEILGRKFVSAGPEAERVSLEDGSRMMEVRKRFLLPFLCVLKS